jgi:hypothetical protein
MYLDGKIQCWVVLCLFVLENRWVWVSEDFFETRIDSFLSIYLFIYFSNRPTKGFKKLEKLISPWVSKCKFLLVHASQFSKVVLI